MVSPFSPQRRMQQAENQGLCKVQMHQASCFLLILSIRYSNGTHNIAHSDHKLGQGNGHAQQTVQCQNHHDPILTAREQHISSKSRCCQSWTLHNGQQAQDVCNTTSALMHPPQPVLQAQTTVSRPRSHPPPLNPLDSSSD